MNDMFFSQVEFRLDQILAEIYKKNNYLHIYNELANGAREAARASDHRWSEGVPLSELDGALISVKDNIDVAGMSTTAGLGFRRGSVAAHDAFVVRHLRRNGAVIVGKTNMHPAAFGATNRNEIFGDCVNPRHVGRVPGGSSGGAAASIAAGWADLALGTDTMGSVRIPASYCGVVGIKPSYGAISTDGTVPLCARLDHVGLLARNVEVVRRGLRVTTLFDASCPESRYYPKKAVPDWRSAKIRAPSALNGIDISPSIWRAFEDALAKVSAAMDIQIERFHANASQLSRLRRSGLVLCEAEMLLTYADAWCKSRSLFPSELARGLAWIEKRSPADVARAATELERGRLLWRTWKKDADVLLLPSTGHEPFPWDCPAPEQQADLTILGNLMGAPAATIPIGRAAGLQIMADVGSDSVVTGFAANVEQSGLL